VYSLYLALVFFLIPSKHADVNAFLVLAATRSKPTKREDPADPNRAEKIIAAATAGHVPVQIVSSKFNLTVPISNRPDRSADLSDKNPLHALSHDADLIDLLALFAGGAHRGVKYKFTVAGRRADLDQCLSSHRFPRLNSSESSLIEGLSLGLPRKLRETRHSYVTSLTPSALYRCLLCIFTRRWSPSLPRLLCWTRCR